MKKPIHPGEILREEFILPLGIKQSDMAKKINVDYKTLNRLVKEHSNLTPEMAIRLSKFFNTSPDFWLNLQRKLDLYEAHQEVDEDSIRPYEPKEGESKMVAMPER